MHFSDGAFYRPLSENDMVQLQVATGCSHNRCRFCDMYHQPFRVSPREEIASDIDELASIPPFYRKRVFLTGGNALALPQKELVFVLEAIRTKLQPSPSVGCFARITDVARKSDEDLAQLVALGLSDISIGAESGLDAALSAQDKGFTSKDIVAQCQRLDAAGLTYNLFLLLGMAGAGRGQEAAQATVEAFGQTHPQRVMVHTMTAFPGTLLASDIAEGRFQPAGEIEMLQELRTFVAETQLHIYLQGNHVGNTAPMCGFLPKQREAMLAYIDQVIATADEQQLRARRAAMESI